jgi:hypothetical protein
MVGGTKETTDQVGPTPVTASSEIDPVALARDMLALGVRRFVACGVECEFSPEAVAKALAATEPPRPADAASVQRRRAEHTRRADQARLDRELRSV